MSINTNTNSMHKVNIESYGVRTVEDSFTCCGHERYTMMMENKNEFFMIVMLVFKHKMIHEGNKYSNV